jgi:hypothetical protein
MKTIRIFIFLLFPFAILVSWNKESRFILKLGTKKINVFLGEITVPLNWKRDTGDQCVYVHAGKDLLIFTKNYVRNSHGPKVDHNRSRFDSTFYHSTFWATDSSYKFSYKIPYHCENGRITVNYSLMPDKLPLGMYSSKISPAKALKIIEVLKTFKRSK